MYSERVVDHFSNPRNVGVIEGADGKGQDANPSCGDFTRITVRIADGRVAEARFKTFGCSAAIASASMVTTLAAGKRVDDAARISAEDVLNALGGLPANKEGCALMAAGALRSAIADAKVRTR
jgi:nitrogen fixation NifU-like protein